MASCDLAAQDVQRNMNEVQRELRRKSEVKRGGDVREVEKSDTRFDWKDHNVLKIICRPHNNNNRLVDKNVLGEMRWDGMGWIGLRAKSM